MADFEPSNGLVIRYDFLWKSEDSKGQEHGIKDRPCAIILTSKPSEDGSRKVVVCPITHSTPKGGHSLEIPPKVSRHLGLDSQKSWIRTNEVNVFTWNRGQVPVGVTQASREKWEFGFIPSKLFYQLRDQFIAHREAHALKVVQRD
ncbi:MAG: hypothetical protein ACPGOY_10945 [Rhodospirillaceae bacterium]